MKELRIIGKIREKFGKISDDRDVIRGIGDDCAVISVGSENLFIITTDTMVENVHFDLGLISPYELGWKSALVNISDLASMGALPNWATLNIAFTQNQDEKFWDSFICGLYDCAQKYNFSLIGGDTVSSSILVINLTFFSKINGKNFLRRDGAKAGDRIYVSGYLGDSAGGLFALKNRLNRDSDIEYLIKRHVLPEPRVELGKALCENMLASATIDLSDGLSTDLAHVCSESGVGAIIYENRLPISKPLATLSNRFNLSTTRLAISGGEDYELLWTTPTEKEKEMLSIAEKVLGYKPFLVGEIREGSGVYMIQENGLEINVSYQGYEHG